MAVPTREEIRARIKKRLDAQWDANVERTRKQFYQGLPKGVSYALDLPDSQHLRVVKLLADQAEAMTDKVISNALDIAIAAETGSDQYSFPQINKISSLTGTTAITGAIPDYANTLHEYAIKKNALLEKLCVDQMKMTELK